MIHLWLCRYYPSNPYAFGSNFYEIYKLLSKAFIFNKITQDFFKTCGCCFEFSYKDIFKTLDLLFSSLDLSFLIKRGASECNISFINKWRNDLTKPSLKKLLCLFYRCKTDKTFFNKKM